MAQQQRGEDVLDLTAVAEVFGVRTRTVQRWVKARQFPQPFRPAGNNGKPFWRRQEVDSYIEAGGIHAYRRKKRGA
jgi:predicted DNA-binding transcriptional regulator AlpA